MSDYKELLNKARLYRKLEHSPLVLSVYDAMVDAITQLVKERDAAVKNMETATLTVDVVRCKDCKYYGYVLTCGCSRIETSEYGIATMKPDDFCSYGKRKEVSECD